MMTGCAGRPVIQNMGCGMTAPCSGSLDQTPTHTNKMVTHYVMSHIFFFFNNDSPSNFNYYVYIYVKRLRTFVLIQALY